MNQSAELELIERAVRGDGEAFERLVAPHLGLFMCGIRRVLKDSEDAQDVLQDALITIHRELHRFMGLSRFSTWGYRICLNETFMAKRRRARHREESLEEAPACPASLVDPVQERILLDQSEAQRFWTLLEGGLQRLSAEQRAVFILRDVLEVDTEQAATRLGITRGLVRQRLHRARAGLRGLLGPDPSRLLATG